MKRIINKFKITGGIKISLKDFDTTYSADLKKENTETVLKDLIDETAKLQSALYADNRYAFKFHRRPVLFIVAAN